MDVRWLATSQKQSTGQVTSQAYMTTMWMVGKPAEESG